MLVTFKVPSGYLFFSPKVVNGGAYTKKVVNGGAYTKQSLYFSWDVRLSSFFLGLLFLALYYRRYHALRELTSRDRCVDLRECLPVVCCLREQRPLAAVPVEAEILEHLSPPVSKAEEVRRRQANIQNLRTHHHHDFFFFVISGYEGSSSGGVSSSSAGERRRRRQRRGGQPRQEPHGRTGQRRHRRQLRRGRCRHDSDQYYRECMMIPPHRKPWQQRESNQCFNFATGQPPHPPFKYQKNSKKCHLRICKVVVADFF